MQLDRSTGSFESNFPEIVWVGVRPQLCGGSGHLESKNKRVAYYFKSLTLKAIKVTKAIKSHRVKSHQSHSTVLRVSYWTCFELYIPPGFPFPFRFCPDISSNIVSSSIRLLGRLYF